MGGTFSAVAVDPLTILNSCWIKAFAKGNLTNRNL
jgi:hypothetical protein